VNIFKCTRACVFSDGLEPFALGTVSVGYTLVISERRHVFLTRAHTTRFRNNRGTRTAWVVPAKLIIRVASAHRCLSVVVSWNDAIGTRARDTAVCSRISNICVVSRLIAGRRVLGDPPSPFGSVCVLYLVQSIPVRPERADRTHSEGVFPREQRRRYVLNIYFDRFSFPKPSSAFSRSTQCDVSDGVWPRQQWDPSRFANSNARARFGGLGRVRINRMVNAWYHKYNTTSLYNSMGRFTRPYPKQKALNNHLIREYACT